MKQLITMLLVVIVITSCAKKTIEPTQSSSSGLIGVWIPDSVYVNDTVISWSLMQNYDEMELTNDSVYYRHYSDPSKNSSVDYYVDGDYMIVNTEPILYRLELDVLYLTDTLVNQHTTKYERD